MRSSLWIGLVVVILFGLLFLVSLGTLSSAQAARLDLVTVGTAVDVIEQSATVDGETVNRSVSDALVDDTEIARRRAEETIPPVPESQTPWEELYREKTGQLAEGGVMDFALKYRGTARKLPRHNH